MKKRTKIRNLGGGAALLTARSAGFGGTVWEKLLRYYGTKALRSNCRVRKPGLQLICQPEVPEARQHTKYWWSLPCHGDVLAEGSQKVNEKLKQVQHDKNFGRICKVQDAKCVSEAHRKHLFPYSPITLFTSKKAAFTLAEVLITLGIIGVVAAMTIPTLISKYQEKQTVTRLTKVFATISNAYQMAKLEYGDVNSWGFTANSANSIMDQENNTATIAPSTAENSIIFMNVMSKYLKVYQRVNTKDAAFPPVYFLTGDPTSSPDVTFTNGTDVLILADGTYIAGLWVTNYQCTTTGSCGHFSVDINGMEVPPNTYGRDKFMFYIYKNGIVPMGGKEDTTNPFETRCNLNEGSSYNGYGCAAWVIYNKNMDYLHCNDLSWEGKHKCSD